MAKEIKTHYIKSGYASSEEVVLAETPRTRTLFRPGLHAGGVRGKLIRQKIGADGNWLDTNEVNFSTLPPDCGVSVELDTEATRKLFEQLSDLYKVQEQGIEPGDQDFVVAKKDEVLLADSSTRSKAIKELLERGYTEEFWAALTLKDPDLASRLAISKVQMDREAAIAEYEASLEPERDSENFWQNFFETNPWILQTVVPASVFILGGEAYLGGKMPIGRAGKGGVATDFLASDASTKSFSVVEIKTPASRLVGPAYRGEAGSDFQNEIFSIAPALTGGVVQVRNQISVAIENFSQVLGQHFAQLNRVHPKGVLVSGMLSELNEREQASFNHFRQGLFSLTIITYDEVLQRLKLLFDRENANPPVDDDF